MLIPTSSIVLKIKTVKQLDNTKRPQQRGRFFVLWVSQQYGIFE